MAAIKPLAPRTAATYRVLLEFTQYEVEWENTGASTGDDRHVYPN